MTTTSQLSRRRRIGVLLICCMSLFIVGLDVTIVNVALPSIGQDLHARALRPPVDRRRLHAGHGQPAHVLRLDGRPARPRRTFVIGLAIFALGSLLCSLAPNRRAARRLPDDAGGRRRRCSTRSRCRSSPTPSPTPASAPRPIGVWGAVFGVSMALGPVVGGALVVDVGWRSIFLINVPVGLAAIALAAALRPRVQGAVAAPRRPRRPARS